jgi:hypothetical protein
MFTQPSNAYLAIFFTGNQHNSDGITKLPAVDWSIACIAVESQPPKDTYVSAWSSTIVNVQLMPLTVSLVIMSAMAEILIDRTDRKIGSSFIAHLTLVVQLRNPERMRNQDNASGVGE